MKQLFMTQVDNSTIFFCEVNSQKHNRLQLDRDNFVLVVRSPIDPSTIDRTDHNRQT